MNFKLALNLFLAAFFLLLLVSAVSAFAANLSVAASDVGYSSQGVSANQLKPAACTQNLVNIIRGSASISGTAGNDLILASAGADVIDGGGGDDCILAGDGDDSIDGGPGADVCFQGAGADSVINCESLP
ncbi:MAG: hypothetical protein OHK0031_09020 [Anaerolineales bacterium]